MAVFSCNKISDYTGVISSDKTKPEPISNVSVVNIAGGANITYTLPKSDNILYVLADYKINNTNSRQAKTSYYSNTIMVSGFSKSQDYTVTLTVVTKANVSSDPVTVTVHPLQPPYLEVFPKLNLQPDFGGANISCINDSKQPIGVVLLAYDSLTGKMLPINQFYTTDSIISRTERGYPSIPRKFGAYVTDPYGNISDTIYATITPYPEIQLDKNKFQTYTLPTDAPADWNVSGLWDGVTNQDGDYAWRGIPLTFPVVCTFDLGVTAKLSRYTIYGRSGQFAYSNENSTNWTIWGSNAVNPHDIQLPLQSNPGDKAGDWINLGNFVPPPKPSGLPVGQSTAADQALVSAGFQYTFPISNPPVRYIRFESEGSYSGITYCIVHELTFFGNPQ